MAIGMLLIPIGDGFAKHVQSVTDYSPTFLSWSRFTIGAIVVLPWVLAKGLLPPPTKNHQPFWLRQAIRALLIASTVTLIIKAVGLSPIADVFGAFFIGPGISVILAQWVLKVRATKTDWIAVVLGFIGVLLVVQPTGVASGCCYGAFLVATRWAAGSGPPMAQLAAQFSIASLCLLPLGLPDLLQHGIQVPLWIIGSALASTSANFLSIIALARAGNAVLAPVVYLQVVSATLVGFVMFSDIPNVWTAIGLVVIVTTGIFQAMVKRQNPV